MFFDLWVNSGLCVFHIDIAAASLATRALAAGGAATVSKETTNT